MNRFQKKKKDTRKYTCIQTTSQQFYSTAFPLVIMLSLNGVNTHLKPFPMQRITFPRQSIPPKSTLQRILIDFTPVCSFSLGEKHDENFSSYILLRFNTTA